MPHDPCNRSVYFDFHTTQVVSSPLRYHSFCGAHTPPSPPCVLPRNTQGCRPDPHLRRLYRHADLRIRMASEQKRTGDVGFFREHSGIVRDTSDKLPALAGLGSIIDVHRAGAVESCSLPHRWHSASKNGRGIPTTYRKAPRRERLKRYIRKESIFSSSSVTVTAARHHRRDMGRCE